MAKQNYIINKQLIDLRLNDEEGVKELQETFRKLYYRELVPVIEQLLDKYFVENDEIHHQINRLEIDLGKLELDTVADQFKSKFEKSLQSLQQDNYVVNARTGELSERNELEAQKTPFNILSYYLSAGRLPWWSPDMSKEFLEKQLDLLIKKPELAFIKLLSNLHKNENSLQRFLNSFQIDTFDE
ncbi:MAG: contractile injection system tape measure protein, partial [Bacteroidota bacterium]